jgi:K+ transporter
VYGDIGTSVLYAFKECLHHGISTDRDVTAVLSLIIWTLFSLVSVKYRSFAETRNRTLREHLFIFLSKNAENAADFFHLPPDRVYEVSQVVEI